MNSKIINVKAVYRVVHYEMLVGEDGRWSGYPGTAIP